MSSQRGAQGLRLEDGLFPVVDGETCIAEVIHGCSASPSPIPTALGVLKISAVTRGALDTDEHKFAPDTEKLRKLYALRQGDVLLCRTNGTLAYVGQSALVESDQADLIFPDKVIRVRLRENMLPAFFWRLLQTPPLRSQIEAAARTAVGNYAIGGRDLWRLRLSLPPLETQQALVAAITAARQRAATLRAEADRLQAAAIAEVEAAILGQGTDHTQAGGSPG
jgi:type I restriction enzyme S subunit